MLRAFRLQHDTKKGKNLKGATVTAFLYDFEGQVSGRGILAVLLCEI
jgi:hypothetical protein